MRGRIQVTTTWTPHGADEMEIEEITRRLQAAEAELIAHRTVLSFLVKEASAPLQAVVGRAADHLPDFLLKDPLTDQQLADIRGHLLHLLQPMPQKSTGPSA